jgi:hypothetical protein
MNKMILNLLMQNLLARRGGSFQVRRVSPWAGFLLLPLVAVIAVVGLVGFAVLSVGFLSFALVRSLLPRPRAAAHNNKPAEPTMTVLDASGKTVAQVPRGA